MNEKYRKRKVAYIVPLIREMTNVLESAERAIEHVTNSKPNGLYENPEFTLDRISANAAELITSSLKILEEGKEEGKC